jgi:cytochrome c-type biogenesis protein
MIEDNLTYSTAFSAGVLSFFSPCIVPLIPAYMSFISGFSLDELTDDPTAQVRTKVMLSTSAFCLGFSVVFILLGISASALGAMALQYNQWIRIAGGVLIIVFGAHLVGIIRIPMLEMEHRLNISRKPVHFFGSLVVGMAFGAGWSPCIGPLLGSILILAGNSDTIAEGAELLSLYSLGLSLPFLLISVFIHYVIKALGHVRKIVGYLNVAAGILLITIGFLLVFNRFGLFWSTLSS